MLHALDGYLEQRRHALENDALARLDEADRAAFAELLERVRAAVPLEETHAYHIDYPGLQATREALLGFGRRLVAEGRLDAAADVFMLRLDELREAVADAWGAPLRALAAQRAAELREARAQPPPLWLGDPPDPNEDLPPLVVKSYGVPGTAEWDGAGDYRGGGLRPARSGRRARVPHDHPCVNAVVRLGRDARDGHGRDP